MIKKDKVLPSKLAHITALALLILPTLTFAQADLSWFSSFVGSFESLVAKLIPIFIALAFLVFVWGLIGFIFASGDDDAKTAGKNRMIWGILALFVITAIWGILALLEKMTGTENNTKLIPKWEVTYLNKDAVGRTS